MVRLIIIGIVPKMKEAENSGFDVDGIRFDLRCAGFGSGFDL